MEEEGGKHAMSLNEEYLTRSEYVFDSSVTQHTKPGSYILNYTHKGN